MNNLSFDNIYSFSYTDPKTKLHVWDARPLVFVLDINPRKKSFLAINLHWIPKKYRDDLLQEMIKIIEKKDSSRNKVRLTYGLLLKHKYRHALQAIRRYIITRVTNIEMIPHKKWDKVLKIKRYKKLIKVNDATFEAALKMM